MDRCTNNRHEAASEEHSTIFSFYEEPSQAKMPNNSPSSPPIRVGVDLLLGAMRFLQRDDLDIMPMVGRSFHHLLRAIQAIDSKVEQHEGKRGESALPQRRLIDRLDISEWDNSFCRLYPSTEVEKNHPRLFSKLSAQADGWGGYALSEADLTSLVSNSVNLRAVSTFIQVPNNHGGGGCEAASLFAAQVKPFASLWEGFKLKIHYEGRDALPCHHSFGNSALPGIGGCSSLVVEGGGAPFDYPLPVLWRCPSIHIAGCWSGIDFQQIVDYLAHPVAHSTAEATEDPERMLQLRLSVPQEKEADYEPTRLKQLLEQRLCGAYPLSMSTFRLVLHLEYSAEAETEKVGDVELVADYHDKLLLPSANVINRKSGAAGSRNCGSFSVEHYNTKGGMVVSRVVAEFGRSKEMSQGEGDGEETAIDPI